MKEIKNFGIGTDIESIGRFKNLNPKDNDQFLNKIFTKTELEYCFSKKNPANHLAVRYAGKEAVVKALSSIGKINLDYKSVEISNNENGVPIVRINNTKYSNLSLYISLSHNEGNAVAFVAVMALDNNE